MDLAAEAKLRASANNDRPPTDCDDPSTAKNIISDPLSCRDTIGTFGEDDDHCVLINPLYSITSRNRDKISRYELV